VHDCQCPRSEALPWVKLVFAPQYLLYGFAGEVVCIEVIWIILVCLSFKPSQVLYNKTLDFHHSIVLEWNILCNNRASFWASILMRRALRCMRSMAPSMSLSRYDNWWRITASSERIRSHFLSIRSSLFCLRPLLNLRLFITLAFCKELPTSRRFIQ